MGVRAEHQQALEAEVVAARRSLAIRSGQHLEADRAFLAAAAAAGRLLRRPLLVLRSRLPLLLIARHPASSGRIRRPAGIAGLGRQPTLLPPGRRNCGLCPLQLGLHLGGLPARPNLLPLSRLDNS